MLEPELDAFLLRLLPSLAAERAGATIEQISQIEALAGRQLPPFYRWFLATMGGGMGPLAYPSMDFSATTIISCYSGGEVAVDPRYLLIAHETDEVSATNFFYDLDSPSRGDALVVGRASEGGPVSPFFETFREMLAWKALGEHRVRRMPQRCAGTFRSTDGAVLPRLTSVMDSLGYSHPIPTGESCGVFDLADTSAMVCRYRPNGINRGCQFFELGGPDTVTLRRVLGVVVKRARLKVEIDEDGWDPPLP